MIEVNDLTVRYGDATAVDQLTFAAKPGQVTGFLGPNGAGKSTTMRAILGLEAPQAGTALVAGRPYASLKRPLLTLGALLDAGAVHGGRTARAHVACVARSNGIGLARVDEVLDRVGLTSAAGKRIARFSLGMKQRLGIAVALLGDPEALMFDEPVNGLDPEGVRWIRELMRALAAEGRAVLVSSHLMAEVAVTADHVVVVGGGRLIADTAMAALAAQYRRDVLVRTGDPAALTTILQAHGGDVQSDGGDVRGDVRADGGVVRAEDGLAVTGLDARRIGELAFAHGIALYELTPREASLEEAFMELTGDSREYVAR